jgi:glycolate oxidase FAD binding subunit
MTDLVRPTDEKDLAEAVATAMAERTPLLVEGSGTKAGIGRPVQAGRTLSTAALNGVTLYEPAELVIGARAGTPLRELEKALAEKGQALTFEPIDYRPLLGSAGEPTVGGMVAGNLSGPRRIAAGALRDSLLGVRFVNGRGDTVKSGGRVMKNVTGLDLARLMAGSWGTLGVLSEVVLKVQPAPETTVTVVVHGLEDGPAVAAMAAALGSPYEVSGAAHLPGSIERVPKTLLRIEGFAQSASYRAGALRRVLAGHGSTDMMPGEVAAPLWTAIRDASFLAEPRSDAVWRVSVAASKAAGVLGALPAGLVNRHLLDWGGGLIWIATSAKGDAGAAAIRSALLGTGGHATLVRAPAELRATVEVFHPAQPALAALQAGVKASFDPHGLLNPGRMYAGH